MVSCRGCNRRRLFSGFRLARQTNGHTRLTDERMCVGVWLWDGIAEFRCVQSERKRLGCVLLLSAVIVQNQNDPTNNEGNL